MKPLRPKTTVKQFAVAILSLSSNLHFSFGKKIPVAVNRAVMILLLQWRRRRNRSGLAAFSRRTGRKHFLFSRAAQQLSSRWTSGRLRYVALLLWRVCAFCCQWKWKYIQRERQPIHSRFRRRGPKQRVPGFEWRRACPAGIIKCKHSSGRHCGQSNTYIQLQC